MEFESPFVILSLIGVAMAAVILSVMTWGLAQNEIKEGAAAPKTSWGMMKLARRTPRGRRLYWSMVALEVVGALALFYFVLR